MALPNPLEAFVWGRGGAKMTPEQIAREREIAASLGAVDTSPVGHWTQGAARMVNALGGVLKERRANAAEAANSTASGDLIARMLSGGGGNFPPAPGGGGSFPAAPAVAFAYEPNGNEIRDGIISTASALGIDPIDLGTAISYETAGTFDPLKRGPTTQHGQHRGFIQFGEPQAVENGVDWNNPVASQLGADGAVAKYLRAAGVQPGMGMLDIYSAINAGRVGRYGASDANNGGAPGTVRDKVNSQMAGHRQKALALLGDAARAPAVAAIEQVAPVQVASLDPGAGMQTLPSPVFSEEQARSIAADSAIPNYRPGSVDPSTALIPLSARPMPEEYAATGLSPEAWERMNAPDGMPAPALPAPTAVADRPVAEPQQQIAQALMGPDTPLDQVPVMAGGNSGVMQQGQAAQGINPAIIEALSSPYADEQTRKIAGMLLGQQMQANDPAAQLDMEYKRAQIDALKAKPDKLPESVRALNMRAEQAGLKPGTPEYNQFMISGGTGPQTIINNGSNTSEFVKKSDEAAAKRMDEIVSAGQTAPQTMADMQQLIELGATIGTGQGAQIKARLGPYAHALGIDIGPLEEIQAYEAITSRLAPQMRATGSGASSDRDVSMFLQSLPSLRNLPQGNEIIANTMKSVAQNKINAAEIARQAQRGEISWQDADRQISELPNPYELFKEFQKQGAKKTVIDGYTIEQVE